MANSEVRAGRSFVIDMPLDGGPLIRIDIEAVSERRARITQRIVLSGENAAAHVEHVQAGTTRIH